MSRDQLAFGESPRFVRRERDAYFTSAELAWRLVSLLPIRETQMCLEPSAGGGAFVDPLRRRCWGVTAIDIEPRSPGLQLADQALVGDFVTMDLGTNRWDWAVGNPPYDQAEAHVRRALDVADNVAMLLRAAFVESEARRDFWARHPARHMWLLGQRPTFTGGGTDNAMYAFFWWDNAWNGASTWSRLDWR